MNSRRPTLPPRLGLKGPSRLHNPRPRPRIDHTKAQLRSAVSVRGLGYGSVAALLGAFGFYYVTDTRSSIHRWLVVPAWQLIYADAEDAHEAGTSLVKSLYRLGLHPRERGSSDGAGATRTSELFGYVLDSPLAVSAGLDKGAELIDPLFALGAGLVEVGGVTPLAQAGNARPRVWRLPSQNAIINRYGLNSEGADQVARRLQRRVRNYAASAGLGCGDEGESLVLDGDAHVPPGSLTAGKLLAVQIAKNKMTPDDDIEAVKRDYVYCVERLGRFTDIITVNVSSPNTPGLRNLQKTEPLANLLSGIVNAARNIKRKTKPVVMVKVSPDEDSNADVKGVCDAVWRSGVDGVIVGNTTKLRPDIEQMPAKEARVLNEPGGYSGSMTFARTFDLIRKYRSHLDGHSARSKADAQERNAKVIFASGGVSNADDVLAALDAGASVAMVYTAMMYQGAGFISQVKEDMDRTASPVTAEVE